MSIALTFKTILEEGWCAESDGHAEAPIGRFAVVEIPEQPEELEEMMLAVFEEEWRSNEIDVPTSGWYFVRENERGQISADSMERRRALWMFELSQRAYLHWSQRAGASDMMS